MGVLESKSTPGQRAGWEEWVWGLQAEEGGFRGSTSMRIADESTSSHSAHQHLPYLDPPHLPSTYTAILVLSLLRADFRRLNKNGLDAFLESCMEEDGSFSPFPTRSSLHGQEQRDDKPQESSFESDARMAYCASVLSDFLRIVNGKDAEVNVRKGKNAERAMNWSRSCQTWEGGFGQRPGLEAHGGSTYCHIAAMSIRNPQLTSVDVHEATRYLAMKQVSGGQGGFQGRPGKDEDVCYSFWCGAALRILLSESLFNVDANRSALLNAQSPIGGFGKEAGEFPDPYHSYLAIAALAMIDNDEAAAERSSLGLAVLDPVWNVSQATKTWLETI